jgi:hydroxymethylglutaryl-CoA lyase
MAVVKIIECPRDAMQGISHLSLPKGKLLTYNLAAWGLTRSILVLFLQRRFPKCRHTAEVSAQLDLSQTSSKLLAIIAKY